MNRKYIQIEKHLFEIYNSLLSVLINLTHPGWIKVFILVVPILILYKAILFKIQDHFQGFKMLFVYNLYMCMYM